MVGLSNVQAPVPPPRGMVIFDDVIIHGYFVYTQMVILPEVTCTDILNLAHAMHVYVWNLAQTMIHGKLVRNGVHNNVIA